MKLIDILARNLNSWPTLWIACAQERNGYIAGFDTVDLDFNSSTGWDNPLDCAYIPLSRDVIGQQEMAEDFMSAIVTRAQWQAAVDALKAECNHLWIGWDDMEACELCSATRKIEAWNGNGRPPVGEWCEILSMPEPKGAWCKGKILYISNSSCVWCWDEKQIDLCANTFEMEFRPIRTPEQIEQEKQQDHWLADVAFKYDQATADKCAAILVDAGYRKQVKP